MGKLDRLRRNLEAAEASGDAEAAVHWQERIDIHMKKTTPPAPAEAVQAPALAAKKVAKKKSAKNSGWGRKG